MATVSSSQSRVSLSELVQSDKALTISDIKDLVIPRLLNIPEDVSTGNNCSQMVLRRLKKFKMDLEHIKDHFNELKIFEGHADKHIKDLLQHVLDFPVIVAVFTDDSRYWQIEEILTRIKICMPSTTHGSLLPGLTDHKPRVHEPEDELRKVVIEPPGTSPFFESPTTFRQFTKSYELLEPLLKACVLCFSAFPEGAQINKRTVIYWWIGEQLIDPDPPAGDDGEKNGHKIIRTLSEHGFLENVTSKARVTSRCRVCPFSWSMLAYFAKAASLFDYLEEWEYSDDNLNYGFKCRVYLVKAQKGVPTSSSSLMHLRRSRPTDLECIETLFNVTLQEMGFLATDNCDCQTTAGKLVAICDRF